MFRSYHGPYMLASSRSAAAQQLQHPVELFQAGVMQGQRAAALLRREGDAQAEGRAKLALERDRVGVARAARRRDPRIAALHQALGGADVEAAAAERRGEGGRGRGTP